MKQVRRVAIVFAIYLSGPLFLLLTSPKTLALPFLVLPFIWLFVVIVCSLVLAYTLVLKRTLTKRVQLNFGLLALIPVLLAILQSIHQLSVKDIILVVGLVLVASFYISRLDL